MRRVGNERAATPRPARLPKSYGGQAARRGRGGYWLRRAGWLSLAVLSCLVALGEPSSLWQSRWLAQRWQGGVDAAVTASMHLGLRVREVLVDGRHETPAEDVLTALGVRLDQPMLAFDPDDSRKRIEALPWVRAAHVQRRLPNVIQVRIVERQPMALWQRNGTLSLVDADGIVIRGADLGRFAKLLVVVGDDAPAHTPALLALLASQPGLSPRVTAAVRVGERRWNLRFDNRLDVLLPETQEAMAWTTLATLQARQKLLERDVTSIDLRLPGRMILRPRDGAPPVIPAKGRAAI